MPSTLRTLVVVPMLLTERGRRRGRSVSGLEVHYLGNRRRRSAIRPVVGLARRRRPRKCRATTSCSPPRRRRSIGSTSGTVRRPAEAPGSCCCTARGSGTKPKRCWMGWERKRGKLHELNALLRGSTTTSILTGRDRRRRLRPDVRYVVTLDADTRLPRGAVGQLVGTHRPSAQPADFDADVGPGDQGYGVLQPRITPTLPERARRLDLPAHVRRLGRHRPVRVGGLRRLPGPVPARAASPARGSTTSMRSRRRCTTGCPRTRC